MFERNSWQQAQFSAWDLRREGFWEALCEQRNALRELEAAIGQGEFFITSAAAAELDLDLLRYACLELHRQLTEAARNDAGQLLAMSVSGNEGIDAIQARWEKWFLGGPVWPVMAQREWGRIKDRAVKLVCAQIEEGVAALNGGVAQEIERAFAALELIDVLKPEVYVRFYSEERNGEVEAVDTF